MTARGRMKGHHHGVLAIVPFCSLLESLLSQNSYIGSVMFFYAGLDRLFLLLPKKIKM
jgi:hypothetical protein